MEYDPTPTEPILECPLAHAGCPCRAVVRGADAWGAAALAVERMDDPHVIDFNAPRPKRNPQ